MPLAPGTRLGPYEIQSPIGAGGMGEVYRARDPRLEREVAIKILPAAFSSDPNRLRRFQQEARAAGALDHPNILAIHDVGTHDGVSYVVSELLEGSTLRERLAGAAVPVRKAVEYALQIARGLAAAHDRGIVHRDLKPENVFVTHDGRVKILDFGLAKLAPPESAGGLTGLPTTPPGTDPGLVMGTIGHMSPEQVRGQPADQRTDIFSLGIILHEMVSGRQTFRRDSPVETMSAILKEEPPELPATARVPPALERIIRHCLEKSPAERFQSARDLAFDLEALSGVSGPSQAEAQVAAQAPVTLAAALKRSGMPLLTGLLAGLVAGAVAAHWLGRGEPPEPPKVRYLTYSGQDTQPSASPDGRLIAFASTRDGRQRIWLKQLPGGDEVALTSGPDVRPRISPDGSTVLFARQEAARSSLYRIPLVGGDPRKMVEDASEGDWSPDGRQIVFLRPTRKENTAGWTIMVAESDGRGARDLAHFDDRNFFGPRWSPDGRTIALTEAGAQNAPNSVLLLQVDGRGTRSLPPPPPAGALSSVAWSGSDETLVYARSESIVQAVVGGSAATIIRQNARTGEARNVMWIPNMATDLEILGSGKVVLGAFSPRQNLFEIPLSGKASSAAAGHWLTRGNSLDRQPAYSPDGDWIMFSSNRSGNLDLWEVSTRTGAVRRLTDDAAEDWDPAFADEGRRVIWSSNRTGHFEIWISEADGTGARQLSEDGTDAENPTETPDGRWIVYNSANPAKAGIWKIHPDGTGATRLLAGTTSLPEVSPDGRFVSYRTPLPPAGYILRVVRVADGTSTRFEAAAEFSATGARSRWMRDGRRLVFGDRSIEGRNGVFVQDFDPDRDTAATRRPLAGFDPSNPTESFGISRDGTRITLSVGGALSSLILAEGLSGVLPPPRPSR